ncbi:hypothetical protein GO491_08320 [Flavobacteriaceae bacterium Ap0902]|nr:hypothetical protein [Flavobacteriaceae bacterium Ap0902]
MKKNLLILLLSIFIVSCSSDDDSNGRAAVDFTTIHQGALTGNGEEGINKQNLVIKTQSDWETLTTQMNTVNNVSDNLTDVDIDFSKYSVIAAFDEVKPNNGYGLELNVTSNSQKLFIETSETLTDEEYVGFVHIQPYHIIKIENSELPIVFE